MPGKRWSSAEKECLIRQIRDEGKTLDEVRIAGRTRHAIGSQALRMELVPRRPARLSWTAQQRRRLRRYQREGLKPREIHEFGLLGEPQRSLWSITKQWGRMRLADRRRSRQMRKKKIWKPGEKAQFEQFLLKNSDHMTPEEIGKLWQVARSTVARRQTELGVKATREEVMQMDYSLAKQRRASQRIRRENIHNWALRRAQREEELLELADSLREPQGRPRERTCCDCGRSWPRRREFFHTTEKRISIGTSRYFKRRCALCENRRRRELERKKRARRART